MYRLRDLRSDMFRFIYHKYLNIESTRIIEFWHPLLGTKYMSCLVGCDLKLFDMAWFPFPNHAHSPRVTHTPCDRLPLFLSSFLIVFVNSHQANFRKFIAISPTCFTLFVLHLLTLCLSHCLTLFLLYK